MRHVLVVVLCLFTAAHAETVDTRLLWRSSEVDGGVVLGDVLRVDPTASAVYVGYQAGFSIAVLRIDADGAKSTKVDVRGEAPGHVNMPAAFDAADDGSAFAVIGTMGSARAAVRRPALPPFEDVVNLEPVFDEPGMAQGHGVRFTDDAVVTYVSQQPMRDMKRTQVRILRHDERDGTVTVIHTVEEAEADVENPVTSASSWDWDVSPEGRVFIATDYHSGTVATFQPDGTPGPRLEIPVEIVRKSDEVIESIRKSYEQYDAIPEISRPEVLENYPAIAALSTGGENGHLYVMSSAGKGTGRESVQRVHWWLVDTTSDDAPRREEIELPKGEWSVSDVAWFGDRIYVVGEDASRDGAPEIVCLQRADALAN